MDKYGWAKWREIAERHGINRYAFIKRVASGWSHEIAATKPLMKKRIKRVPTKEMQIYTIFKHRDPVFTGLADDCANYLQVDQEYIYDHSKIKNCIVFEVE